MALVIVIDDDPTVCKIIEFALTLEGHEVVTTSDPRVGVYDL
jgi:DNA-binding response OmpR family regulator